MNWEKIKVRDPQAWLEARDEIFGVAYGAIGKKPGLGPQDIDEAVMEAVRQAYCFDFTELDSAMAFKRLLATCAIRRGRDQLRANRAQSNILYQAKDIEDVFTGKKPPKILEECPPQTPRGAADDFEKGALLSEALVKLSEEDQTLIEEWFFDEFKQREIAEKRGWGITSVGKRLENALNRLRDVIDSDKTLSAAFRELRWPKYE